jgi:alpha-beta hydrolase superfamily lysophospholipase
MSNVRRPLVSTLSLALLIAGFHAVSTHAHTSSKFRSGVTSFWFADSSGTPMAAIVYHPSVRANGQPLTSEMFPAVVFMQGGNVDANRYAWLQGLAEHGYVIVLPDKYPVAAAKLNGQPGTNTNTKLTTVDVLDHAVKRLPIWATDAASPIFGRFDGRVVVAGHSLGGVVAITAVDEAACLTAAGAIAQCPVPYIRDPSIVAMWLIGGHFENPNGPPDSSPIHKPPGFPIYLIAGSRDGASTPTEVQTTFRRYGGPKIYYELPGANHFNWTEYLHPEDDLRTDLAATITRPAQQSETIQAVRRFLDCHLANNTQACALIPATPVAP